MSKIEEVIKRLPDLPDSVFKLQKMRNDSTTEISEILEVLQDDPFIIAKIMELANSKLFGFTNKIESLNTAVSLYGINFTTASAIFELINNTFNPNLEIYKITKKRFFYLSEESIKLMLLWLKKSDLSTIENLMIPCFISKIGTCLISDLIDSENKNEFNFEINQNPIKISEIEKKFTRLSSSEITVMILEKWKFDEKTISLIRNIDNPNSKESAILKILNIIFNPVLPFSKEVLLESLKLTRKYNLDENKLKEAIEEFVILTKYK